MKMVSVLLLLRKVTSGEVRLMQGVGITSKGVHLVAIDRKHTKVYSVWKDMLYRGYSPVYKRKHTSYMDVYVCDAWLDFQTFGDWFVENYQEGFQLDKDILKKDNLVYCPEYCRFIPQRLNKLFTNRKGKGRNSYLPLGVSLTAGNVARYIVHCNDGTGRTVGLGTYSTPEEASAHYVKYKLQVIRDVTEYHYEKGEIAEDIRQALLAWDID